MTGREPCPLSLFGIFSHSWERRFWDKFGTGRRDVPYFRCRRCGKRRDP